MRRLRAPTSSPTRAALEEYSDSIRVCSLGLLQDHGSLFALASTRMTEVEVDMLLMYKPSSERGVGTSVMTARTSTDRPRMSDRLNRARCRCRERTGPVSSISRARGCASGPGRDCEARATYWYSVPFVRATTLDQACIEADELAVTPVLIPTRSIACGVKWVLLASYRRYVQCIDAGTSLRRRRVSVARS